MTDKLLWLWAALFVLPVAAFAEEDTVLFDDMLVEASAVEEPLSSSIIGAVKLKVELWEDGVIPVQFPSDTTVAQKSSFFRACRAWEQVAGVKCLEGSYKGRVLRISKWRQGCFALYGMGSNFLVLSRRMNLEEPGCWGVSTIIHELGHSLGLVHEHQRPDRNDYVEIRPRNADGGWFGLNLLFNFAKAGSTPLTPYDFLSIMHYSRKAFSKNGQDTIVPRAGYERYLDLMGHGATISEGDARAAAALYGPPKAAGNSTP